MKIDYFLETLLAKWRHQKAKPFVKDKNIILEIGCGDKASFLKFLSKDKDKRLIGIDPKLKQNIEKPDNLLLIKDKIIDKINLDNNSVDCVMMLAVLEHLDYPEKVVGEIQRILKPNGLLCLTTPTPFAKRILEFLAFVRLLDSEQVAEHKNYFNREDLVQIAKRASLKIVEHQYFQLGCNNFFVAFKQ